MEMCQAHWDMLRKNVIAEGLGDWIAPDGETAIAMIADEIDKGEHTKTNYDPLMNCHWMIMHKTIEMVGVYALTEEFGCPVCFLNGKRTEDGRCTCDEPNCGGKVPGSIPPFETWLEETPKACRMYMAEQGWLDG